MHFTKMHGLGNDYLYVFGEPKDPSKLSVTLSDRHFGAGSDGMIWISKSDVADFKMRIFNSDGSEAKMCGNGIRCVGKYVYDKGYTDKKNLKIETLSGIKNLTLNVVCGKVKTVSVEMGKSKVEDDVTLDIEGEKITLTPAEVGNPHAVIIYETGVEDVDIARIGSKIEHHPYFPGGVNVEFVQKLSENRIRMRVWERGSGITMACGTGACAACAVLTSKGICDFGTPITVELDGGSLTVITEREGDVIMRGEAELIYEGEYTEC